MNRKRKRIANLALEFIRGANSDAIQSLLLRSARMPNYAELVNKVHKKESTAPKRILITTTNTKE